MPPSYAWNIDTLGMSKSMYVCMYNRYPKESMHTVHISMNDYKIVTLDVGVNIFE